MDEAMSNKVLFKNIKKQVKERLNASQTHKSKDMSTLLDLRLKQKWGISHSLQKMSWHNEIIRKRCIWTPPKDGWLKCNFDCRSKGNRGLSGARGIIRGCRGYMIEGIYKPRKGFK